MKKLMIAAAIVCAAAFAQAASMSWAATKNDILKNATVYLVEAANYDAAIAALNLGGDGIAAKMAGYDIDNVKATVAGSKGAANGSADVPDASKATGSEAYYWIAVQSGGAAIADEMAYVASGAYTYSALKLAKAIVEGADTATPFSIASSTGNIFNGASGTIGSGAAPEPTTGLLMLVGLAGLALRRKQA